LGVVLGQVQVDAKSNEIPALRTLLEVFDLVGAVVTADAMHTQTTTATYITGRGGHYVLTVKGNQPGLLARCKALPWAKIRAATALDRGHGRRVRRTIKVAAAPAVLDFAGAVQVAQIRRTRTIAGKKSVEVVYVITSMPSTQASPTQIAAWVQGHWATREPAALGARRRLRRRPLRRAHRPGATRHGHLALHRDQRPTPDRDHQHRRSDPTPRPQRPPPSRTALDLLKHDYAEALGPGPWGEPLELSTRPVMVSTGQIPWPSPGTSRDRHRAGFTTASGQNSMALDTEQRGSLSADDTGFTFGRR